MINEINVIIHPILCVVLKLFKQLLLHLSPNLIHFVTLVLESYDLLVYFNFTIHLLTTLSLIKFTERNLIFVLLMQSQRILVNSLILFHYFVLKIQCYFLLALLFYLLHYYSHFLHSIQQHFTPQHFLYHHFHLIENSLCFEFLRISIYTNQFNIN